MIYLDNAATTRMLPEAAETMQRYLNEEYGNPSAVYGLAMRSRAAVDHARDVLAASVGAEARGIYFTSGGTEADNWALQYALEHRCSVVTSTIEHHAVLESCRYLAGFGVRVTYVPPKEDGIVDPSDVEAAMSPDVGLVSVMTANNEIGTIQRVRDISRIAHRFGAVFHTDAVQAYGHIPIHVEHDGIDMMSVSAHKLHGPKGIGFLYIRPGIRLGSFLHGGAQERGRRAGTENTPAIAGFGKAAELMFGPSSPYGTMQERMKRECALRDYAMNRLEAEIPGARILGDRSHRLPGNISVLIPGADSEQLLIGLDMKGICASAGSACAAGSLDPSHVVTAVGVPYEDAFGALRLSLSFETTKEELDAAIDAVRELTERNRVK